MSQSLFRRISLFLAVFFISGSLFAENKGQKAEDLIPLPQVQGANADLNQIKRAKLTEEQAINQLKFMMVKGFARMEKDIVEKGTFPPFGLSLLPDGTFKAVIPDTGDVKLRPEVVLPLLAKQMEAIAQTRTMWAVGIMYIRKIKRDDGSYAQRLIVMTEHIAGWARHWAYPFKVENGEVKLGKPTETPSQPVYYVKK